MKRSYVVALVIVLGALLASLLLDDPGRITFAWRGWLLDMALPVGVLLTTALWLLVRGILRGVSFIQQRAQDRLGQEQARSYAQLARGLTQLSAGQWREAEQTLTRSAFGAAHPLVHYLAAARAAELLGDNARRDEWLTKAVEVAPEERAAVHISHAEMLLRHNQLVAAQSLLEQLDVSGHQNARGLTLLARIYRQQGDWQKLKMLEPRLRRTPGIAADSVDEVLVQVHLDMLKAASTEGDAQRLSQVWREVPKSMMQRADISVTYARAAMHCGQADVAESTLREYLHDQWDDMVVMTYGDLTQIEPGVSQPLTLLQTTEKWLATRPRDATLLYTAARCCIRNELYGKARTYLEASIGIKPRQDSYQLLAKLLELSGEREQAFAVLNDALAQAVGRKATMPKLRAQRLVERRKGMDRRER